MTLSDSLHRLCARHEHSAAPHAAESSSASCASAIFERNATPTGRDEPLDPLDQAQLAAHMPSHLASDDYTSPVLDSTVELIANGDFDACDVVQVPHRHPSLGLLRTCSRGSKSPISRKYSNTSIIRPALDEYAIAAPSASAPFSAASPVIGSANSRKSISFYSFSDLVNLERIENQGAAVAAVAAAANSSPDEHTVLLKPKRRPTIPQGSNTDTDFTIDEKLGADGDQLASDPVVPLPKAHLEDGDGHEVFLWQPEADGLPPVARHRSIVDDLASIKSHTTNNTFFGNELEQEEQQQEEEGNPVPLVNVCSAGEFLKTRSRELRQSFVDNEGTQRRFAI